MIKVIEGYELKKDADMQSMFIKLRSYAMTFQGFIDAEYIKSVKGNPIAALLYNWEGLENWQAWETSKLRQQMLQEAQVLSISKPRITIYEVMPTSGWTYTRYHTKTTV
jgi:heme-degrading monooxygenase HmoA